jgi:hypothetical protein
MASTGHLGVGLRAFQVRNTRRQKTGGGTVKWGGVVGRITALNSVCQSVKLKVISQWPVASPNG